MRIHHLNLGSMRELESTREFAPAPAVCHALLIETPGSGLVLVETAFGGRRVMDQLVGDPLPRIC